MRNGRRRTRRNGFREPVYFNIPPIDINTLNIRGDEVVEAALNRLRQPTGSQRIPLVVTVADLATAMGLTSGTMKLTSLMCEAAVATSPGTDNFVHRNAVISMGDGRTYSLDLEAVKPYRLTPSKFHYSAFWTDIAVALANLDNNLLNPIIWASGEFTNATGTNPIPVGNRFIPVEVMSARCAYRRNGTTLA